MKTKEWKIGEIFEYNGEWLQCVEQPEKYDKTVCAICAFQGNGNCELDRCSGTYRSDKKSVIFKKLEKVGEQFLYKGKQMQSYIRATDELIWNNNLLLLEHVDSDIIDIEIKEDMEEKKVKLDKLVTDYTSNKIAYNEFEKAVKELYADKEESKPTLKPFDLEAAKAGKSVCTRDGRKARIICFDKISGDDCYKIVACVTAFNGDFEEVVIYGIDGYLVDSQNPKEEDLMMLPEKKEGWVNVYKNQIHDTPKSAEEGHKGIIDYIKTIRVEWEE